MFIFDARIKDLFFDRLHVRLKLAGARFRALNEAGRLVRRIARRSIRPARRASPPGRPPHSHTGALRRGIVYAAGIPSQVFTSDLPYQTVVVGVVRRGSEEPPIPALLEEGGVAMRRNRRGRLIAAHYPPRPYMKPALEQAKPKIPEFWRDSVKV